MLALAALPAQPAVPKPLAAPHETRAVPCWKARRPSVQAQSGSARLRPVPQSRKAWPTRKKKGLFLKEMAEKEEKAVLVRQSDKVTPFFFF